MSMWNFVRIENPSNSENLYGLVNNENVSKDVHEVNDYNSFSNPEILGDLGNNSNISNNDCETVVNTVENDESSSYNIDFGKSSFTTSPVILYLRPEDHNNEENSENDLQNKSYFKEQFRDQKRPFTCNICTKTFKRRHHYNIHLYTHKTERAHICKTCNKAFTHHYFLQQHKAIHNTVKQFSCIYCNEEFSVRRYYTRHMRRHRKKIYECDACDFICYKLKESIKHVKMHGGNIFSCTKCDRCFYQEISLNLHQCFQSDEKLFSCKLCPRTFRKIQYFERHMAVHENKKSNICEICKKGFNTKWGLRLHIQGIHEEENEFKPYSCQVCEKKFHLQVNLKKHENFHQKKKMNNLGTVNEYNSYVSKTYSSAEVGYLNIESPVPQQKLIYFIPGGKKINYVCNICLKGFRYRSRLTVHYRIHTGEKPFQCNICNWSFADKSDLTRHSRIHTGERKYSCDACGRRFMRKTLMTAHFQTCINRRSMPKITSVFTVNQESV